MIRNYFKTAWRNVLRNKGLSFINIFGLSVGMAFVILTGLWIQYENSFDTFHENIDRIVQVRKHTLFNNEKNTQVAVMLPLYDELRTNYPEVKRVTRVDPGAFHSLVAADSKFNKKGHYVDPDFLKMFSFPLLQGNADNVLTDLNSIVLTESLAKTLFGDADPMGKMIKYDNQYTLQVTGVVKDPPKNSSLSFEFLIPYEFRVQNFAGVKMARTKWGYNFVMNFIELNEGASMTALSKKIGPLVFQKDSEEKNQTLFLHPMSKLRLYDNFTNWVNTGGRADYVRLFSIVGVFVLLIACINFMNLATARSEKRAREVGVRKAIGSGRIQIMLQFLTESMLTAFIAFLVSIGIIQLALPLLAGAGFADIRFDFGNTGLLTAVLGVCILTGLFAGSYPAFYLSSFLPVKILKGRLQQGRGTVNFRKVLVVSQFVISIGLMIGTAIVFQQIDHARQRSIGYDPENLITIAGSQDLHRNYAAMKQELLNTGHIEAVSRSSSPMTTVNHIWDGFRWTGQDASAAIGFDVIMTEFDYEKTARLKFLAGRPFSPAFRTDSSAIIINEAAWRLTGFKDPIGQTIKYEDDMFTVIGVTENVVMNDPFKPVSPAIMLFRPNSARTYFIRLKNDADLKTALSSIQPVIEKYNPALPFEYSFADEDFGLKFSAENQAGSLAGIFAVLAVFISCLGLFGLAAFMAERRTKEIGVRKILGASVINLWMLLSREFVLLVLLACCIASPLTYWLMTNWLQKYDYRIDISWWLFAIAGMLAIAITLVTVSTQAAKAALANPVKSLRSE